MLEGIEWVLFDAVGTLIYPCPAVAEVYWAAGKRFGSRLSVEEIRGRFSEALQRHYTRGETASEAGERERWRKIVASVFDDIEEGAEALYEGLWQHFAEPAHWRTFDDAAALAVLAGRGYRIGIASNFDGRLEEIVWEQPLLEVCERVFVSSCVGFSKPDWRFFRGIEEQLGVEAGRVALVGDDGVNDIEGAKGAGWRAIEVDREGLSVRPGVIRSLVELV